MKTYLPVLLEGLIGCAFHPLILIGYGLNIKNDDVSILGMAYLAFGYLSLGKPQAYSSTQERDPIYTIQSIHKDKRFDEISFNGEIKFQQKVKILCNHNSFFLDL